MNITKQTAVFDKDALMIRTPICIVWNNKGRMKRYGLVVGYLDGCTKLKYIYISDVGSVEHDRIDINDVTDGVIEIIPLTYNDTPKDTKEITNGE